MFSGLSFRKKIILGQIISFIILIAILFPLIERFAARLVRDSLIESTSDLKDRLQKAGTEEELIQSLKRQEYYSFFRMSLINDKGLVIYDTHMGRLLGPQFQPYYHVEHNEVKEALRTGVGYVISKSDTFGGKFAYVAETFPFQGKTYVLRTAFPYEEVLDLTGHFKLGVLIYSFVVLLFFNILIWLIISRFTQPIRSIISAITPYQQGEQAELPEIILPKTTGPKDEFQRLASAFNSLSARIQKQINDLRTERNEKEAILESLGEGVIAVNEKMEVLYINFIACKMLGLTRRNVIGHTLKGDGDKIHHELLQKCQTLLTRSQQQGNILTDSLAFGKERKTYIDLIAAPKAHGMGAIIVLQDKTSHYRVLEMGKDFVANASHELRTPITIIKGYAETLHDMPELKPHQVAEITEKIGRSCVRMEALVNNLLRLADIENITDSRFLDCNLIPLIENSIHMVKSVHSEALIEFDRSIDQIQLKADSGLLELAITNILENAVKYSDPPAKIRISVAIEDEDAIIEIADKGRGIPADDLPYIFERFYRVDKTHSRRLGGAGLGLSIVKTIISKHDGTITATSELGKGATFRIVLPLRHHNRF
ncbi:MAG: PAS domain-containing protein [Verrucomicrobia bacterium]|nr:PAS domain-containing protein [Verrucomicrobiota bacterium]